VATVRRQHRLLILFMENIYRASDNEDNGDEIIALPPENRGGVIISIALLQAAILIIAVAWGYFRKIPWWSDLHASPVILWGVLLGAVLAGLNRILYTGARRLPFAHIDWIIDNLLYPLFRNVSLPNIIFLSLLSGFCEEALFRGILQAEWGIIVSNIIFGALHTGDRRLIFTGVWTMLLGFSLGFAYLATGNLLVPMAAHAVNNLLGLVYVRYYYRGKGDAGR
jgi:uncharacterized protein